MKCQESVATDIKSFYEEQATENGIEQICNVHSAITSKLALEFVSFLHLLATQFKKYEFFFIILFLYKRRAKIRRVFCKI